ncbi:MAG: efflux RND transporter periplasmic adaptor subunit, partial [Deltaproteobacteria bacterium]|nr:efflux RND transporter periplasmic adaptor subunit [Deltaproteobacteria bacterium]
EKMLLIPAAAVVVQGQLTAIFILDAQKTARFRLIRTGRIFDNGVEVISGLMEGERFVVRLPDRLEDGVRVEVAP